MYGLCKKVGNKLSFYVTDGHIVLNNFWHDESKFNVRYICMLNLIKIFFFIIKLWMLLLKHLQTENQASTFTATFPLFLHNSLFSQFHDCNLGSPCDLTSSNSSFIYCDWTYLSLSSVFIKVQHMYFLSCMFSCTFFDNVQYMYVTLNDNWQQTLKINFNQESWVTLLTTDSCPFPNKTGLRLIKLYLYVIMYQDKQFTERWGKRCGSV